MPSVDDIITLESNDGQKFPVTRKTIAKCEVVCTMIDHLGDSIASETVPFNKISGPILKLVVEWLTHHAEDPEVQSDSNTNVEPSEWDKQFLNVDQSTLFEIIMAANFLNVQLLLDMCCKSVAGMIKGKTVEEIRKTFGIKNDFTPEEEQQIRAENAWCEED